MLRMALARSIISLLPFFPIIAFTLGLGDIRAESFLNQPLRAEVPITNLGNTRLADLKVQLAPVQTYKDMGLPVPEQFRGLRLAVQKNKHAKPIILLSTKQPIVDTVITVMLEVSWPQGDFFREYTLLLNPPPVVTQTLTRSEKLHQPTRLAKKTAEKIAKKPAKKVSPQRTLAQAKPVMLEKPLNSAISRAHEMTLAANSLREVAAKVKPAANVTVEQTMVALFHANPHSFREHNINRMKPDVRLRIPSLAEVRQISAIQAKKIIAEQRHQLNRLSSNAPNAKQSKSLMRHALANASLDGELGSEFNVSNANDANMDIEKQWQSSVKIKPGHTPLINSQQVNQQEVQRLQSQLALTMKTLNSLEKQQAYTQLRMSELQKLNQQLKTQLIQRDRQIVSLAAQHKNKHQLVVGVSTISASQRIPTRTMNMATHALSHVNLIIGILGLVLLLLTLCTVFLLFGLRRVRAQVYSVALAKQSIAKKNRIQPHSDEQ